MLKFFYNVFDNIDLQSTCSLHTAKILKFLSNKSSSCKKTNKFYKKKFEKIECEVLCDVMDALTINLVERNKSSFRNKQKIYNNNNF